MNKTITSIIAIFALLFGLISCEDTIDSNQISLVGIWQNTRIDTLVQFITPVKPDTIITKDCKNCMIEINDDNSFKIINSTDTVIGNWNQTVPDTLTLLINDKQGNFISNQNMGIEKITSNELKLISYGGRISGGLYAGHSEFIITEEIKYKVEMYYERVE